MNTQEIAAIILRQLGGNKFIAMTGAKDINNYKGTLNFKIGRNKSKANTICIELNENDTYTMTFSSFRKMELKEVKKLTNIYFDKLQEMFTDVTGLSTRL